MNKEEFDLWMNNYGGYTRFYAWLFDKFPEKNKDELLDIWESGDYLKEFEQEIRDND